jgi:uncharacterized protein YecT (DUF1311 family)
MMKIVTVSLGIIIALSNLTVPSHAQDRPVPPSDCNKAITQTEMNLCAQNRAESADKRLNNTYQILQRRLAIDLRQGNTAQINLAKTRYQKLINAQNAWIKFRDTTCEYERSNFDGGSIAPMIYHDCVAKITDRRTADLQEYSKDSP